MIPFNFWKKKTLYGSVYNLRVFVKLLKASTVTLSLGPNWFLANFVAIFVTRGTIPSFPNIIDVTEFRERALTTLNRRQKRSVFNQCWQLLNYFLPQFLREFKFGNFGVSNTDHLTFLGNKNFQILGIFTIFKFYVKMIYQLSRQH